MLPRMEGKGWEGVGEGVSSSLFPTKPVMVIHQVVANQKQKGSFS